MINFSISDVTWRCLQRTKPWLTWEKGPDHFSRAYLSTNFFISHTISFIYHRICFHLFGWSGESEVIEWKKLTENGDDILSFQQFLGSVRTGIVQGLLLHLNDIEGCIMHDINDLLDLSNPCPRNPLDDKTLHTRKVEFRSQRKDKLRGKKSERSTSEYTVEELRHVLG